MLATAVNGLAGEVNCKQVNKYLQTGRSAKDVAETMVISESDVEKCKAAAPADGVQELANVLDLRADFEADAGKTRLLLLFSPT